MSVPSFPHASAALVLAIALAPAAQAQPQPATPVADNCEGIRLQIEARFRAGGVAGPALAVLPAAAASGAGRVVGSCGNGSRVIVHTSSTAAAPPPRPAEPPAERSADKIPTECKDGSIVIGPRCDDPRAVRMSSAEIAGSAPPPAKPASQ